ncbi:hypothetical protein CCR81_02840, partial [Halorhodospira halophila]|nr:hypothetical protein [Halorhodospira halophila]
LTHDHEQVIGGEQQGAPQLHHNRLLRRRQRRVQPVRAMAAVLARLPILPLAHRRAADVVLLRQGPLRERRIADLLAQLRRRARLLVDGCPAHITDLVFPPSDSRPVPVTPTELETEHNSLAVYDHAGRNTYWPDLDTLSHQHGVDSAPVRDQFRSIDIAWQRLLDGVQGTDTVVLATADHGLIDTAPERTLYLEDHPELAEMLALPLCGEPRAAYCYLRPGTETDFQLYCRERLGAVCQVARAEELLAAGWFGPMPEHPRLRRRIGDWVLLPADGWVIKDRLVGEGRFAQVGVHGGASASEQWVPLIAARP